MFRYVLLFAAALAVATPPTSAQSQEAAEALATVGDGEAETLDLQSVRRFGEQIARFETVIAWSDATRAKPSGYMPRRVRYVGDCDKRTITISAVAVFNAQGEVQRNVVIPPGGADPVTPEKGTALAKALRQACMF
jgi:hypothetical protein